MNGLVFSKESRRALTLAQECARELGHGYVGTEHLLVGLMRAEGSAKGLLVLSGLTEEDVSAALIGCVGRGFSGDPIQGLTLHARAAVETAAECARERGGEVETTHLLLGLLKEENCTAVHVLRAAKVDPGSLAVSVRDRLREAARRPQTPPFAASNVRETELRSKLLKEFTVDLNQLAREGRLDPVIGRENEVRRTVEILTRRTKNNPVLIGEPGVGKTAVAEELARRIVRGDAVGALTGKKILSLDLAALIAGTKFRGEFEDRLRKLIVDAKKDGNIILFIDELHNIVGAGSAEGAIDAANILKPALSRGEIQIIGATTFQEYRKYIEKDAALERRFQSVQVKEPCEEEALAILRGLKGRYEAYHGLSITEEAVRTAVQISSRYIHDRFLPDKAIDLLDEAAARVRLRWEEERGDTRVLEARLSAVAEEKKEALLKRNYAAAEQLAEAERDFREELQHERTARPLAGSCAVTEEAVAAVASEWTGIPLRRLTESEAEKLMSLQDRMEKAVVGQPEATSAVARAIRRSRMGLGDPKRPVGAFLFLGPTGVGKTELSRALAEELFGDAEALIRIDMSEYTDRGAVTRLIGAPPGYVGHDEGGQLTEKLRRRPYSVVLFDEIEKAHEEIWNMLLQILEDGRVTDSHGRTADFKNAVVILTSNVGAAKAALAAAPLGFVPAGKEDDYARLCRSAKEELQHTFRPEFLNRLDEVLVFRPLRRRELSLVAEKLLGETKRRLAAASVALEAERSALELLAEKGYDPRYGARPLRRLICREVEDPIAEKLLAGELLPPVELRLCAEGDTLCIREAAALAVAES